MQYTIDACTRGSTESDCNKKYAPQAVDLGEGGSLSYQYDTM